jgi:hypothetical protein
MAKYMTHEEAKDRVMRWAWRQVGRFNKFGPHMEWEKTIGPKRVDVVAEHRGLWRKTYDIYEVKTDEEDLERAQTQLNLAASEIKKRGAWVRRWLAVTADLYGELVERGKWKAYEDIMTRQGIGILLVYRTKVEKLREAQTW